MTNAIVFAGLFALAIPAVVDLVTKSGAPHWLKTMVAGALAALDGAIHTVVWTPGERWTSYALAVGSAFVVTMSAHATGYSEPIQRGTAHVGITARRRHRPVPPRRH